MENQVMLQEAQKSLPALSAVAERFGSSFQLHSKIEDAIGNLLDDETYNKDSAFLIEAHQSMTKSTIGLLEAARRYVDSLAKLWGTALPPPPPKSHNEAPPGEQLTPEAVGASLGNSKFGDEQ